MTAPVRLNSAMRSKLILMGAVCLTLIGCAIVLA
jgi:hypothetical protein